MMAQLAENETARAGFTPAQRADGAPTRLHHHAYVTTDMERTRHFFEDLLNMPLIATWAETDEIGGRERSYCHAYFGLGDSGAGGALAFFQFATERDFEELGPVRQPTDWVHVALKCEADVQRATIRRLRSAGYDDGSFWVQDHGYCVSLYVRDPNGLLIELTVDAEGVEGLNDARRHSAHEDLARWLAGDHRTNNPLRAP